MMPMFTPDEAYDFLQMVYMSNWFKTEHRALVVPILADSKFHEAPGSTKYHHDYFGGLVIHTAEVVSHCLTLAGAVHGEMGESPFVTYAGSLDLTALLVAAMLHDYCKTLEYDYKLIVVDEPGQEDLPNEVERKQVKMIDKGSITGTEYRDRIGHIVGSTMIFQMNAMQAGLELDFIMKVMHIMLSHHGRLEWRSPVEPQTPEAFILHSADMLSAKGWKPS